MCDTTQVTAFTTAYTDLTAKLTSDWSGLFFIQATPKTATAACPTYDAFMSYVFVGSLNSASYTALDAFVASFPPTKDTSKKYAIEKLS